LLLLAPFAPHVSDEIWEQLKNPQSIHLQQWPEFDPAKTLNNTVSIAVQIAGKLRDSFEIERDAPRELLESTALDRPIVQKWIGENVVRKVVAVPNKIVNIVL